MKKLKVAIVIILSILILAAGGLFAWVKYTFSSSHAKEYGETENIYTGTLEYNPDVAAANRESLEKSIAYYEETGESEVFLEYLLRQRQSADSIQSCYLSRGGLIDTVKIDVSFTELRGQADMVLYRAANYESQMNIYAVKWEEVWREAVNEAGSYSLDLTEYDEGVYRFAIEADGDVTSDGEMKQYSESQNRLTSYIDFTMRFEGFGKKLLSLFGEKPEDYNTDLFVIEY